MEWQGLLMDKKTIFYNMKHLKAIVIEPHLAYAMRVKILRQIIKLLQSISQALHLSKPDRLEEIKKKDMNPRIKSICLSYNAIVKVALSLSQPSESLDEKWNSKWDGFLKKLQKLEEELIKGID